MPLFHYHVHEIFLILILLLSAFHSFQQDVWRTGMFIITCGDKGTGRPQWCFLHRLRGGVNFSSIKGVIISARMGTFVRILLDWIRINKQLLSWILEECMTNCTQIKKQLIKGRLFKPGGMLHFWTWSWWNGEMVSPLQKAGYVVSGNVERARASVGMTQWWRLAVQICPCSAVRKQLVAWGGGVFTSKVRTNCREVELWVHVLQL